MWTPIPSAPEEEAATKSSLRVLCVLCGQSPPLTPAPYNQPRMKLLRRRDVIDALGITSKQLTKLIESGLIRPIRKRGCRAWFRFADLGKI